MNGIKDWHWEHINEPEMTHQDEQNMQHIYAFETALTALREKRERMEPEALTLEQINSSLVGKPLFIKYFSECVNDEYWGVLDEIEDGEWVYVNICEDCQRGHVYAIDAYTKTWLAYAHMPGGAG